MERLTTLDEGERIVVYYKHIGKRVGTIVDVEEEGFLVVFDENNTEECFIGYTDKEVFELI